MALFAKHVPQRGRAGQSFGQVINAFIRIVDRNTGIELARYPLASIAGPVLVVVLAAMLIPLAAFAILSRAGRLARPDAASIAAAAPSTSTRVHSTSTACRLRGSRP